jgi:DNA-binding CsgD family transcriptional regulator
MASPLSEREFEVLNLLSRGFSNAECADILTVSPNTIGTHVKNIYRKLEVNSRAEALFEASTQGLLERR